LKLLLSGCEPDEDDEGEAFPARFPGIEKPLSTKSIRGYYSAELFHYLDFYHKVKQFGLPFKSFLECPAWVLQLQDRFDGAYREMEGCLTRRPDSGNGNVHVPASRRRPHIRGR
jgi:hypothetical protein